MPSARDRELPITTIERRTGWEFQDFHELWSSGELLWILAARDIKVRYKQTAIGVAWAVLQPLMVMVVFTTLFRLLGRLPTDRPDTYSLSLFCGQLPWQLLVFGLTQSSESLVNNRNMITKVYFPRMLVPMAPIVSGLLDFGVGLVALCGLMAWYGVVPSTAVLVLPAFVLMAIATALGAGLWLSALNALYRDVRYALPFLIQLGFFVSPVIFVTRKVVPTRWLPLYAMNPMVGVIDGFRWSLLGEPPPGPYLLVSMAVVVATLLSGALYFRRMEKVFADRV